MAQDFPAAGDIEPKTFPFLLVSLHRQGATGSLKVEGPTYQKALYFRTGRVLFGSSNDPRDQLGAILVEQGRLTPEQLDDVNTKVGPGSPLAKVLADSGLVSQQELSEAARAKVERIFQDVISYTQGRFEFEDGVLPKGAVDLKLSTERVLIGAVRRVTDRAFVLAHLESLQTVLTPLAEAATVSPELATETAGLLDHLDGRRTLKDAIALTRLDEFEGAKIACALLFLGLARAQSVARTPSTPSFIPDADDADAGFDLAQTALSAFDSRQAPAAPVATDFGQPEPADAEVEPPFFPSIASAQPEPAAPIEAFTPAPPPPQVSRPPLFEPPAAEPVQAPSAPLPLIPPPPRPWENTSTLTPVPPALDLSVEPEAEVSERPAFPAIAPPSQEDRAALEALLHSHSPEPSRPPAVSRSYPSRPPAMGSLYPTRHGSSRRPMLLVVALIALALGAGAFWFFQSGQASQLFPSSAPSPTPLATLPAPTLAPEVTSSTLPSPSPAESLTPSASAAPTAPPPPSATPAPAQTPPAARAEVGNDPRPLLERGFYPQAAQSFLMQMRSYPAGTTTIVLLVACSDETIQKAVNNANRPALFILPTTYGGKACYRLCWGVYDGVASGETARREVPAYFTQGGAKPRVVPLREALK